MIKREKEEEEIPISPPSLFCANLLRRVPLSKDLFCHVYVTQKGIESPADGDQCVVTGFLILPCKQGDPTRLLPELEFRGRIDCMGEELNSAWGSGHEYGRAKRHSFHASTWKKAFTLAEYHLIAEVQKIREVLLKREEAYFSEGYELLTIHKLLEGHTTPQDLEWEVWCQSLSFPDKKITGKLRQKLPKVVHEEEYDPFADEP